MKKSVLPVCLGVALLCRVLPAQTPQLSKSGCPMAHCDAHLNDAVREMAPTAGNVVQTDTLSGGARHGLGCSSNGSIFACSFASKTDSNLIVYDADGNRIFAADPSLLNANAFKSAPIVFSNGQVLAADNFSLILFNTDGTVAWQTTKPDTSSPISPVLIEGSIVLLATSGGGTLSTYDLTTGALLASFQVTTPSCGPYNTLNTPAVEKTRAYIVSACVADETQGGLAAVDVTAQGANRGTMTQVWLYSFPGPSGASPLFSDGVLFFDGVASAGSSQGTFMGVSDSADGPALVWSKTFNSHFAANAAQDPRGGIWVFPTGQPYLFRLSNTSGTFLQGVEVPVPEGQTMGTYIPSSAVSISRAANNDIVMTFGGISPTKSGPAIVAAEDITTGTLLWSAEITGPTNNQTAAQFPIAVDAAGLSRIAFPGYISGTYFVGAPAN